MKDSPQNSDANQDLRQYLWSLYEGVFDGKSMEDHIRDYVGFTFADQMVPQVARLLSPGNRLLDLGCGFGAFVIAALRLGLDAYGLELARFEVEYARGRLANEFPELDPNQIFQVGDAQRLPYEDNTFDAVTMWNLLEHVPDMALLLKEAKRVLKPGGTMFIICPNYGALAKEAHYLVPWVPFLPRPLGPAWLRLWGKNPAYFKRGIFPLSNARVLSALEDLGMQIRDLDKSPPLPRGVTARERLAKLADPGSISEQAGQETYAKLQRLHLVAAMKLLLMFQAAAGSIMNRAQRAMLLLRRHNPMKRTVCLYALKLKRSAS